MTAQSAEFPVFRPRFPWLGADLQTLRNYLTPGGWDLAPWPTERLWFSADDGSDDRLQGVLHLQGEGAVVVLLHGLTGCEESFYVLETARFLLSKGLNVLRLNLRGAGPSRSTCEGHYCAGSSADLAAVLRHLPTALDGRPLTLVGYSLGGNVVLKFLAEHGAGGRVSCGIAVSPPIDLAAASTSMMAGRNTIYHRWLLKRMAVEAGAGAALLSPAERSAIAGARTVYEFDDRFVAPRNGFAGADDYYARCSALGMLHNIETPALLIHARNDPWIPAHSFENLDVAGMANVDLALVGGGGHVGFHGRGSATPWHNTCIYTYLRSNLAPTAPLDR